MKRRTKQHNNAANVRANSHRGSRGSKRRAVQNVVYRASVRGEIGEYVLCASPHT